MIRTKVLGVLMLATTTIAPMGAMSQDASRVDLCVAAYEAVVDSLPSGPHAVALDGRWGGQEADQEGNRAFAHATGLRAAPTDDLLVCSGSPRTCEARDDAPTLVTLGLESVHGSVATVRMYVYAREYRLDVVDREGRVIGRFGGLKGYLIRLQRRDDRWEFVRWGIFLESW